MCLLIIFKQNCQPQNMVKKTWDLSRRGRRIPGQRSVPQLQPCTSHLWLYWHYPIARRYTYRKIQLIFQKENLLKKENLCWFKKKICNGISSKSEISFFSLLCVTSLAPPTSRASLVPNIAPNRYVRNACEGLSTINGNRRVCTVCYKYSVITNSEKNAPLLSVEFP